MTGSLAARIAGGFAVGDRWYRWGTCFAQLRAAHPDDGSPDPRWLAVACRSLGEIEIVDADVHGPHPDRPVTLATYGLPAAIAGDRGLATLRDQLDRLFGAGNHREVDRLPGFPASASVRAASDWRAGDIAVALSAFAEARDERFGRTGGRLYLRADEARLAGPYLAQFLATDQPWARTSGTVERFATGGEEPRGAASAADHALRHPHLHQTPRWIAEALGPGDVALWSHDAGVWGIADRSVTIAVERGAEVTFDHERCAAARGPGWSAIEWRDHGPVLELAPGPTLLDALAERLWDQPGVTIEPRDSADA